MKTFYSIFWIIALIAWFVFAVKLMIAEMWIANIFMWIFLLAKQGKLKNDKASIKDYLFGFIDGFRYTKQIIETQGNEELLVCDCKNTCDELTDVGEKVFKCKGLPK